MTSENNRKHGSTCAEAVTTLKVAELDLQISAPLQTVEIGGVTVDGAQVVGKLVRIPAAFSTNPSFSAMPRPLASLVPSRSPAPRSLVSLVPSRSPAPRPLVSLVPSQSPVPRPLASLVPSRSPAPRPLVSLVPSRSPAPRPLVSLVPSRSPAPRPLVSLTSPSPSPAPSFSPSSMQGNVESRHVKWSSEATALLIAEYGRHKEQFSNSALKKQDVWEMVAAKMAEKGCLCNGDICWKKWRNLKDSYKRIRKQHKTGSGHISWEFYKAMNDVLYLDPSCQPSMTIGTDYGVVCHTHRPRRLRPPPEEPLPSTFSEHQTDDDNIEEVPEPVPQSPATAPPKSRKRKLDEERTNVLLTRIAVAIERRTAVQVQRNELIAQRNDLLKRLVEKE